MNEKVVLIVENSNSALLLSEKDNKGSCILEGTFAEFGIKNKNNRIYEEAEYLPHLQYLVERAKTNRLLGEIDHPERFDVELKKVSHMIQDLSYDETNRRVRGKIKLLNTPEGKIAQQLLESGVPLSISSRAAGVVGADNKVKIKKIFTYDIVAEPGFESAQLTPINESLGYASANESNIAIYDISDKYPSIEMIFNTDDEISNKPKLSSNDMTNESNENVVHVTVDQLHKWSELIDSEFKKIHEKLNSQSVNESSSDLNAQIRGIKGFLNYIKDELDGIKHYSSHLYEGLHETANTVDMLKKSQKSIVDYAQYVAERQNSGMDYTNYIVEQVDGVIGYADEQSKMLNKSIQYTEKVADITEKHINHVNESLSVINEHMNWTNIVADKANAMSEYIDMLGTKLNESIQYADYNSLLLDRGIQFSEAAANKNAKEIKSIKESVIPKVQGSTIINESVSAEKIHDKVTKILESAKNTAADISEHQAKYNFLKYLPGDKKTEFLALAQHEKQAVCEALSKNTWFVERDIIAIWESAIALTRSASDIPVWLQKMPAHVLPIWESLSVEDKTLIAKQAQYTKLDSPNQIRLFWATRPAILNFNPSDNKVQKLNESEVYAETAKALNSVKSENDDYVKMIGNQLKRSF